MHGDQSEEFLCGHWDIFTAYLCIQLSSVLHTNTFPIYFSG